jgi:hypothetical protein
MYRFTVIFGAFLSACIAVATAADASEAEARIGGPGFYSFEGAPGYPACNPYNRYYNPDLCGAYNPSYDGYYPVGAFADGPIGAGGTYGRGIRGGFYRSGRLAGRYW